MLIYEVRHTYIHTYMYVYVENLRLYRLYGKKMPAKENVLQHELRFKMVFFSSGK